MQGEFIQYQGNITGTWLYECCPLLDICPNELSDPVCALTQTVTVLYSRCVTSIVFVVL